MSTSRKKFQRPEGQCVKLSCIFSSWISNHIHIKLWDVITHPCPNFNGSLFKPPLELGHGWIITSHRKPWWYCRIWSWSPMPCEKHGLGFCRYWGQRAMFFTRHERPWSNPIIARSLIEFFSCFIDIKVNFSALKWAFFGSLHGC